MKKKLNLAFIVLIVLSLRSYAQSNTFPTSGNVGIGTTTPGSLLTVSGSGTVLSVTGNGTFNNAITVAGSINRIGNFAGTQATSGGIGFTMNAATYTDLGSASGAIVPANSYIGIGVPTFAAANTAVTYTNAYNLYINGPPVAGTNVTITNPYAVYVRAGLSYFGGNLLIGKTTQTNSSYLLDVGGNVRSNGIVVNTTGADFVFEPSYQLDSLSIIKKYLEKNHHLPGIASAKEMHEAGLNLGENETKLLQKVEELTLYVIDKDEKQKQQESLIALQQKQINELKDQLKRLIEKAN